MSDVAKFLEDGRIQFTMSEEVYTIRPPRLGEYKKLKRFLLDGVKKVQEEDNPDADGMDNVLEFMRVVFNGSDELELHPLSDRSWPENEDELPPWIGSVNIQARLFRHWRQVPLDRGSN